jgi:hypothetical protein
MASPFSGFMSLSERLSPPDGPTSMLANIKTALYRQPSKGYNGGVMRVQRIQ